MCYSSPALIGRDFALSTATRKTAFSTSLMALPLTSLTLMMIMGCCWNWGAIVNSDSLIARRTEHTVSVKNGWQTGKQKMQLMRHIHKAGRWWPHLVPSSSEYQGVLDGSISISQTRHVWSTTTNSWNIHVSLRVWAQMNIRWLYQVNPLYHWFNCVIGQ